MTERYEVVWSDVAESDLIGIIDFIALNSPDEALEILERLRTKAATLFTFPKKGRVVPELLKQGVSQYRELVIPPWRLIYRIGDNKVFVLSLLDSRRNLEDILLRRMIEQ